MPLLSQRTNLDLSGYSPTPIDDPAKSVNNGQGIQPIATPSTDQQPGFNAYMRCPLPPFWAATPDSLRTFYSGSTVPQYRLFNPPAPILASGTTNVTDTSVSVTNSSGGSGSGSGSGGGSSSGGTTSISQAAIVTSTLSPNAIFASSVTMSRVYQLVSVQANAACRVELYGNASAQSTDISRPIDTAPPAGSTLNLITDVVLDTAPYTWGFQDRNGSNQDNPRTPLTYVTITNIGTGVATITVTLTYAPLVA